MSIHPDTRRAFALSGGRMVLKGEGDGTYDEACQVIRDLMTALTQQGETTPVSGDEVGRVAALMFDAIGGRGGRKWRDCPPDLRARYREAATDFLAALHPTDQEAERMANICQQARHSSVLPIERDEALKAAATMLRAIARRPTDQEAIRREALEEAARVVEGLAQAARTKMHPKEHPLAGGIVDGMYHRTAVTHEAAVTAIRALMSAPEKEVG